MNEEAGNAAREPHKGKAELWPRH